MTVLFRPTRARLLLCSRSLRILNVFQRKLLQFFKDCGRVSACPPSPRDKWHRWRLVAHIIHERLRCSRGSAAATSLLAGRLDLQFLIVLAHVGVGPSRLRVPVSKGGCAILRRTAMKNVSWLGLVSPHTSVRSIVESLPGRTESALLSHTRFCWKIASW